MILNFARNPLYTPLGADELMETLHEPSPDMLTDKRWSNIIRLSRAQSASCFLIWSALAHAGQNAKHNKTDGGGTKGENHSATCFPD